MAKKVGICFSKELNGITPLSHIVTKFPVYMRLLKLMRGVGWEVYVLTRKTYKGNGIFEGGWIFDGDKFSLTNDTLKIDLIYDRTGGVIFPLKGDNLTVVNKRNFKFLACDKFATYKAIGKYMPQTFLVEDRSQLQKILTKIKSDWVVLKPVSGLKGIGIFVGKKSDAMNFKFNDKYNRYIAQEFVDTSHGVKNITPGKHDLRIVVINGEVVWCHVRVPAKGSLLANAAQGGNLAEVDYVKVQESVKNIVDIISKKFYKKYDNPIFSIDFGINENGVPKIFEINDQIGFPRWDMKNRDIFLNALVLNFKSKLSTL